ncbi:hypothetical protein [Streptomyces sp. NPDC059786]|uniref:hypothetical protein n=1 Tax=Streptomyces sp. NPDC059786 TaxID=3346946 RepID=UPI0036675767
MPTSLPPAVPGTGHPVPPAPGLTADALVLLVLASGPTVCQAVLYCANRFAGLTWPPPAAHLHTGAWAAAAVLQLLWLARLLGSRITTPGRIPKQRPVLLVSLAVFGALVTAGPVLHLPVMAASTEPVLRTVLLAWLAREVCRRHHLPLSRPVTTREPSVRRHTAFRQTSTVAWYCLLGTTATTAAVLALRRLGPAWLPVMRTDQLSAIGIDSPAALLRALAWTVVQEGVVIAVVSLLLHTARRPTAQIYTLIAVPEVIFHAYFGAPAVLMAIYAVLCARFYLHHHRLGPLLLGHLLYDLAGVLAGIWPLPYRIPLGIATGIAYALTDRRLAAMSYSHGRLAGETAPPENTEETRT